jgi:hypothetical protein
MIKNARTISAKTKIIIGVVNATINGEPSFKIALNTKNPINDANKLEIIQKRDKIYL